MSCLAEIGVSVISLLLAQLWNLLGQPQGDYLMQYDQNEKDLMDRKTILKADIDSVQELVKEAKRRGENNREMQNWQGRANNLENRVKEWEKENDKKSQRWWHAPKLDWCSRCQLSRNAKMMIDEIDALKTEAKFIKSFSSPARIPRLDAIPTSDFIQLATSMVAVERIVQKVKGEKNVIGVYGKEGVGKTTLIEQVVKRVAEAELFEELAIVTVSKHPDENMIQNTIAEFLDFKIQVVNEHLRRAQLSEILRQKSKLLIILDDVRERLDLRKVGIPYGNDHQGCKIIVTSRDLRVCNDMETEINVHIEEVPEQDALDLFKIKAGIQDRDAFDPEARDLIKRCGGLPKSIIEVGRIVRNKHPSEWNDALRSAPTNISGFLKKMVFGLVRGYHQLKPSNGQLVLKEQVYGISRSSSFSGNDSRGGPFSMALPDWSTKAVKGIMRGLMDEANNIIGVYGYWGVGRTRLIEELVKQVKEQKMFDKVVTTVVSQTPTVNIIQDTIAEFLGFKIEEEAEYLRRAQLSERLKQKNKVLIILVDLRERLDLGRVGIPYGKEHRGCKIIVTSESADVCNFMETNVSIRGYENTIHGIDDDDDDDV